MQDYNLRATKFSYLFAVAKISLNLAGLRKMFQRNKKTGLANKVPKSDLEELFRAKLESDSELLHRR